jgi:hypothetical protein
MHRRSAVTTAVALALSASVALAACGGSGGDSGAPSAAAASTPGPVATTAPPATEAPAVTEAPATPAPSAAAALVPGSIAYRVLNQTASPVDVYLRSQGLVQAEPAALGLEPGDLTDALFPPDPGAVVVLPAGEGDATCVSGCSFLAESTTTFGEGDLRIVVVGQDGATEFWANPDAASVGAVANALAPADPDRALVIVDAGGMADAAFGLNVGIEGIEGCVADAAGSNMLLGGTSVVAYPVPAEGGALSVYPAADKTCTGPASGGPLAIAPAPAGSRTFLTLWGAAGAAEGLAIPLQ